MQVHYKLVQHVLITTEAVGAYSWYHNMDVHTICDVRTICTVQVTCFGMGLVTLDIRQESSRHSDAIDTITKYLGIGSYKSWDEDHRVQFLIGELTGKRPLMPPGMSCGTLYPPLPVVDWSLSIESDDPEMNDFLDRPTFPHSEPCR